MDAGYRTDFDTEFDSMLRSSLRELFDSNRLKIDRAEKLVGNEEYRLFDEAEVEVCKLLLSQSSSYLNPEVLFSESAVRKITRLASRTASTELASDTPIVSSAGAREYLSSFQGQPVIVRREAAGDYLLSDTIVDPYLLSQVIYGNLMEGKSYNAMAAEYGIPVSALASCAVRYGLKFLNGLLIPFMRRIRSYPFLEFGEYHSRMVNAPDMIEPVHKCKIVSCFSSACDGSGGLVFFMPPVEMDVDNLDPFDFLRGYQGFVRGVIIDDEKISFTPVMGVCFIGIRLKKLDAEMHQQEIGNLLNKIDALIERDEQILAQHEPRRREIIEPLYEELRRDFEAVEDFSKAFRAIRNDFLSEYSEYITMLDHPCIPTSLYLKKFSGLFQSDKQLCAGCTPGSSYCIIYAFLIFSCINMGINPVHYLTHLFLHAGAAESDEDWDALLPGNADLSDAVSLEKLLEGAKPDIHRSEKYVLRGGKL